MRRECRGRRGKENVIVVRSDECAHRDQSVSAGTVLDDHRLTPQLGQPVGQKAHADIDTASGPQRNDEFHRPLRPGLRRRLREQRPRTACQDGEQGAGENQLSAANTDHELSSIPWPGLSAAAFAKAPAASLTLARRSFSEDGRNPGRPRVSRCSTRATTLSRIPHAPLGFYDFSCMRVKSARFELCCRYCVRSSSLTKL